MVTNGNLGTLQVSDKDDSDRNGRMLDYFTMFHCDAVVTAEAYQFLHLLEQTREHKFASNTSSKTMKPLGLMATQNLRKL